MKKYTYLEHTADVKFQAFGNNLEEAFSNAALAFTNVVVEVDEVQEIKQKKIEIESENKKSLLYDFLEKLLILMETEHFVLAKVVSLKIQKEKALKLTAVISGDIGLEKYDFERQVKAITYNDMFIEEKPDKTTIQVVLDL